MCPWPGLAFGGAPQDDFGVLVVVEPLCGSGSDVRAWRAFLEQSMAATRV
ncbi:hypothetical protein [Streptomyces sp. NPDC094049]